MFICYDISNRKSFENILNWKYYCPDLTIIALIGCKSDLHETREVSTEEGQLFAKILNANFMECSAKTSFNVNEAF